jgi:hypothetical protein
LRSCSVTANITLGPATRTGPLALEIAGAAVFSVLWFVVGLTHTTELFVSIYGVIPSLHICGACADYGVLQWGCTASCWAM